MVKVCLVLFIGTFVVLQQDATSHHYQTLTFNDRSQRPVMLPSAVTHLDKLRLEEQGVFLEFPWDVTIGSLQATGSHKLTVKSGATVTLDAVYEYIQGIQCSFVIESGATLQLPSKQPVYITPTNPLFEVSGLVTGYGIMIGDKGKIQVNAGGTLRVSKIELKDDATAEFKSGSRVGTAGDSQFMLDAFVVGVKSRVIFDTEMVTVSATVFEMKSQSSLITTSARKNITVSSDNISIGSGATIDLSSAGQYGSKDTTVGGSYGGQGGGDDGGHVYGSVSQPVDYGRGPPTAHGGGIIKLQAARHITVDGKVIADGASSTSTGAGSGGSVWVVGQSVSGLGVISANGGNGGVNGGGGSGGRVAIHVSEPLDNFQGIASAFGGSGHQNGAAGTVYKQYVKAGVTRRDIVVDNKHLVATSKTVVSVPANPVRLQLRHEAVVTFDPADHVTIINDVIGDYSCTIIVGSGQTVRLLTTAGLKTPFALACKVRVDEGANVALPEKVLFTDTSAGGPPTLDLRGTLINVREMYIGENARVKIDSKANTGVSSTVTDSAGTLSFMQLHVLSGGVLHVGRGSTARMSLSATDLIQVHYNGTIYGTNMAIEASSIKIAYEAVVDVNEGGKAKGLGSGQDGSGGSYGGCGGKSSGGGMPTEKATGSIYRAKQFGAIGGNSTTGTGGVGGGILKVVASNNLQLDGTLSAQGQSGVGGGGGGSGGSVDVDTQHFGGSGSVSVRGGNGGTAGGGGGGGGRIVFRVTGTNSFSGKLVTQGGHSSTSWMGSSGTALIQSKVQNAQYKRILKIDNDVKTPTDIEETYLKEGDNVDIILDELHLGDNVRLRIISSHIELTAHSLNCVSSVIIYVSDHLVFTADTSISAVTIQCSFVIHQLGEVRLPSQVTFLGSSNVFEGMLWLLTFNSGLFCICKKHLP